VVVVDDVTMKITHIIRGDDHLNNTPRQILLYQAFNYPLPSFAHMSLTLGTDRARLSKRHGATSVMAYREMGYLPQALNNFIVRLGWSCGDQEIFSTEELIQKFSLEHVGKSAGIFNAEKLNWLNAHYIKGETDEHLAQMVGPFLQKKGYELGGSLDLVKMVKGFKERSKTLEEMAEKASFYFKDTLEYEPDAAAKFLTAPMVDVFTEMIRYIESTGTTDEKELEEVFKRIQTERGLSLKQLAQGHRVALTGGTASPGIYEVMAALGKERVIRRLQDAMAFIKSSEK
jgi:glutamyl-tRNA synthetase